MFLLHDTLLVEETLVFLSHYSPMLRALRVQTFQGQQAVIIGLTSSWPHWCNAQWPFLEQFLPLYGHSHVGQGMNESKYSYIVRIKNSSNLLCSHIDPLTLQPHRSHSASL